MAFLGKKYIIDFHYLFQVLLLSISYVSHTVRGIGHISISLPQETEFRNGWGVKLEGWVE